MEWWSKPQLVQKSVLSWGRLRLVQFRGLEETRQGRTRKPNPQPLVRNDGALGGGQVICLRVRQIGEQICVA